MSGFVVEGEKQNFVIVERDKEDFFPWETDKAAETDKIAAV